jgi:hypothetical protein
VTSIPLFFAFKDSRLDFTEFERQVEGPLAALESVLNLSRMNPESDEKFIQAFTFPLYHASQKSNSQNLQRRMQLLFTPFLVGLLDFTDGEQLFQGLLYQTQVVKPAAFHGLVEVFLRQLDYELAISNLVQEISVLACQDSLRKMSDFLNRGMTADTCGLCSTCGKFLQLSKDRAVTFPCGHAFHKTIQCRPSLDKCSLCTEQKVKVPVSAPDSLVGKPQNSSINHWIRRLTVLLKPNYRTEEAVCPSESACA